MTADICIKISIFKSMQKSFICIALTLFLFLKIPRDTIYLKDLENIWMSKYLWCFSLTLYMYIFLVVLPARGKFFCNFA